MHQALILMQINITQYVLVKLPRSMDVFNVNKSTAAAVTGMRAMLLKKMT